MGLLPLRSARSPASRRESMAPQFSICKPLSLTEMVLDSRLRFACWSESSVCAGDHFGGEIADVGDDFVRIGRTIAKGFHVADDG